MFGLENELRKDLIFKNCLKIKFAEIFDFYWCKYILKSIY